MTDTETPLTIETALAQVEETIRNNEQLMGHEVHPYEKIIADELCQILFETEIKEEFPISGITTTANSSVEAKAGIILGIEQIRGMAIPGQLMKEPFSQLDYSEQILKYAPWVNIIHAWMKVLSEMNSIGELQRNSKNFSPDIIASIAHDLFSFTVLADGNPSVRSDEAFANGTQYAETYRRTSGRPGVNSSRHVNQSEMMYILGVFKEGFRKK